MNWQIGIKSNIGNPWILTTNGEEIKSWPRRRQKLCSGIYSIGYMTEYTGVFIEHRCARKVCSLLLPRTTPMFVMRVKVIPPALPVH